MVNGSIGISIYNFRTKKMLCIWVSIILGLVNGTLDELGEFEKMMAEPKDRSRWVDPLDMGMRDMKHRECHEFVNKLDMCEDRLKNCLKDVEKMSLTLQNNNSSVIETNEESKSNKEISEIFLKRHVSHLIQKLNLEGSRRAHLNVEIVLSSFDVKTLIEFTSQSSSVHAVDVDNILRNFVRSYTTYEKSPLLDILKEQISSFRDPLLVMLLSICLSYTLFIIFRKLSLFKILSMILLVSVTWHWVHMYKAIWASKHTKLMQNIEIPPECKPQDMTWFQTLQSTASSMINRVDKCEEYHKAMLVDPIYEVNPLTAMVDLTTTLLLHPLSSLGKEIGSMFNGLLGEVPFLWKLPVLLVFLIFILFFMVLLAGYEIRLPFFLGKIGPANSGIKDKHLEKEIDHLKSVIQSLTNSEVKKELSHVAVKALNDYQTSGVEELAPLGYECHERTHVTKVTASNKEKGGNDLVLSTVEVYNNGEVKKSALPTEVHNPIDSVQQVRLLKSSSEVNDGAVSGEIKGTTRKNLILTPVKSRVVSKPDSFHPTESSGSESEILDLTKKDIRKSPTKSLSVRGCQNPRSTKFEWIVDNDDVDSNEVEIDKYSSIEVQSEFLSKVENVFNDEM